MEHLYKTIYSVNTTNSIDLITEIDELKHIDQLCQQILEQIKTTPSPEQLQQIIENVKKSLEE